ncbi:MAG: hypothetical protein ACKOCN_08110 [Planctomycetaceae bacterium]
MNLDLSDSVILLRWGHILAAAIAVGGLFFARFAFLPAVETLEKDTASAVHERARRGWLPWVILSITLLLVTGTINFLLFNSEAKTWGDGTWMKQHHYHAIFGVKVLLALTVFYLASGLVGRGAGTQWLRDNSRRWISLTLLLSIAVVMVSGWMRGLHTGPSVPVGSHSSRPRVDRETDDRPASDGDRRYQDSEAGSAFRESARE